MPARKMLVDRRFVREHDVFFGAVHDRHHVDSVKLGAALAPICVRDDVMTPDLAAGLNLAARGEPPSERVRCSA